MTHWTDRNQPHRPLAFGAGILIILSLAFAALAPLAAANQPAPNPNQVEFWCPQGGVKDENPSTPFEVPDPPEGFVWTLLVLKAGDEQSADPVNELFPNPIPGEEYERTDGRDISHTILCFAPVTTTTTTSTTVATTTTEPEGDPEDTTTTTTTVATTTTAATTTTSCPDCTPGQQTVPTTLGTTTTAAPCLNCRAVDTVPPTTVATTSPPTTATTLAPTTAPPVTTAPTVAPTTAPAAVPANDQLPVTGGSPWWLALFGVCLCALGGLAVLWVRTP